MSEPMRPSKSDRERASDLYGQVLRALVRLGAHARTGSPAVVAVVDEIGGMLGDAIGADREARGVAAWTTEDQARPAQDMQRLSRVLAEVAGERARQDARWGVSNHPDGTGRFASKAAVEIARTSCKFAFSQGMGSWHHIMDEAVAKAFAQTAGGTLRARLIDVAAVAVAWVEDIDRRQKQ